MSASSSLSEPSEPATSEENRTSTSTSTNPPTPDDISRWSCHISLQKFGEELKAAADAAFPNISTSRYTSVSVLMIMWEDEDPYLPVSLEIAKLNDIFQRLYGFETEVWRIPGQKCHAKVNRKILDLADVEGNPSEHLLIVYYAGHGLLTTERLLAWTSRPTSQDDKCPIVQWSAIQKVLEQAESDALILLDCCHAGTASSSGGNGATELISACAYNSRANGVGAYSFTKELSIEFRDLSRKPFFTVAELYRNVFSRIQSRRPEEADGRERHPAPVHLSLTQDSPQHPRSIHLSPLMPRDRQQEIADPADGPHHPTTNEASQKIPNIERGAAVSKLRSVTITADTTEEPRSFQTMRAALPDTTLSTSRPRMLFAIRLRDNVSPQDLSVQLFKEWLRNVPTIAEEVKVEAGFGSFSSILILSMPINISIYIPKDPAIIVIAHITSANYLNMTMPSTSMLSLYPASITKEKEKVKTTDSFGAALGKTIPTPTQETTSVFNDPYIGPVSRRPTFETGASTAGTSRLRARLRDVVINVIRRSAKGTYRYRPINSDHEIRVLRIQHGKDGDPLECMLFPSAHSENQKWSYTALSYWWGDPDEIASNQITIYKDTGARGERQTLTFFNPSGTFFIRDNLNAALLRFRHATKDVNVWVDAICIDQNNKREKSSQVARMHEVYTQAEAVCVWLGEGNDDTEPTFKFLESILDLQTLDELIAKPEETAESWALVLQLMTNHWFSRRWVIQELALARKAYVRCGRMELWWGDFADSIALFMTKYEEIKRSILDQASLVCRDPESIILNATDPQALGVNVIVHAAVNLFRKSHEGRIEQRLFPLEILVSSLLLAFEATEPRDTIFAVLMLANDSELSSSSPSATRDPRISPDYEKCLLDVYADFIDYCIQQSQSLDILCRYWAVVQKQSLFEALRKETSAVDTMPSWIPLIKDSAFGDPRYIVEGRANGDGFVGSPERKGQQIYNASAGLCAWHKFGMHNFKKGRLRKGFAFPMNKHSRPSTSTGHSRQATLIAPKSEPDTLAKDSASREETSSRMPRYNGSLYLRGFCLDIISQVSGRVAGGGIIPSDALVMAGWDFEDKPQTQTVPDKLWRTLVADRGPDGKSAPPWYSRICWECLQHQDRYGDLDIPELMKNPNTRSTQITFLKRVQPIVWGRRFFETKGAQNSGTNPNASTISGPAAKLQSQKPLFGLGNPAIRNGDLICILFGCSVPVVLRKDHEGEYYQIIGECYVHGMMDGEAIAGKAPAFPYDRLEYSTFEIR